VTDFTPWAALAGGAMIGLSAVLMMLLSGRIAGIAGIAAGALPPWTGRIAAERLAFVAGLVAAPLVWLAASGAMPAVTLTDRPLLLVAGGLLAGFGTVLGAGCTSGHGVCGLARLSRRSLVAVAVFMAVAMAVVFVLRHA
jgi:uncharacterized membrane protein YedE/YeeE